MCPPLATQLDRGNHYLALAYLHLLFLGGVTPFVWWFSTRLGWLSGPRGRAGAALFFVGVLLSEAYLFAWGLGAYWPGVAGMLLAASGLMAGGVALIFSGVKKLS